MLKFLLFLFIITLPVFGQENHEVALTEAQKDSIEFMNQIPERNHNNYFAISLKSIGAIKPLSFMVKKRNNDLSYEFSVSPDTNNNIIRIFFKPYCYACYDMSTVSLPVDFLIDVEVAGVKKTWVKQFVYE